MLPRPLLDRLGLHEGSDLQMEETADGLILKAVEDPPSMVKKQGLWVYVGKVPADFDVGQAIRDDREERIQDVSAQ